MNLHTEVLALQERWGITYKDSPHWLYMTKLEKVETSYRAFKNMDQWLQDYLKDLSKQFGLISISADIIPGPDVGTDPNPAPPCVMNMNSLWQFVGHLLYLFFFFFLIMPWGISSWLDAAPCRLCLSLFILLTVLHWLMLHHIGYTHQTYLIQDLEATCIASTFHIYKPI